MAIFFRQDTPTAGSPAESPAVQFHKVFVVLNPVAGQTDGESSTDQIEHFCQERGWDCDIHETKPDEDVSQLVREALAQGVDLVIAAGGDGTVSAVVAGMVNSEVPMGILPSGTGNALARDLTIPLDLPDALDLLASGFKVRALDVMQVNQKAYYVLNVSVGVSSLTMRTTQRSDKRRFGMLAYAYRAVGSLRNAAMHRFSVRVDGRPVTFSASELMIANSKLMGMQPRIEGLEIDPNDGRMDVFIVRAQTVRDYINVALGFLLRRDRYGDETINYLEARQIIHIESEFPLPVQADGEELGVTPVEVKLMPNALRVIVPANGKNGRSL